MVASIPSIRFIWVIKVPTEKERYGVFNPYIVIDDHSYDGYHLNGIIDLTDKGIGVRQSSLWIDYNID